MGLLIATGSSELLAVCDDDHGMFVLRLTSLRANFTRRIAVLYNTSFRTYKSIPQTSYRRTMSSTTARDSGQRLNKLALSKSPYLLQHAENPVFDVLLAVGA